jgi:hypothetical protein
MRSEVGWEFATASRSRLAEEGAATARPLQPVTETRLRFYAMIADSASQGVRVPPRWNSIG